MDGGKVGRSMSTQPCDNGDGRRGPNSLPEDGADRKHRPVPSAVPGTSTATGPFAKINLQEFIPESQVIDYEEVDSRRLRLSCFQKGTTEEDVADLCKGAVSTEAVAAAQVLDGVEVKGCRVRVTYMGERWHDPGRCPPVSSNILDISNVPSEYCSKEKLQPIFKLGEVTKVSPTGTCKVVFPSSTELIKTVRDPSHHTLDGQRLKFAMGIESVLAQKLSNVIAKCAKRPTKSPPPKTSRGKSSGQNKMARKK
ncbi:hypothetical protein MTO96_012245 [Rhipicephalus appendiculatus]